MENYNAKSLFGRSAILKVQTQGLTSDQLEARNQQRSESPRKLFNDNIYSAVDPNHVIDRPRNFNKIETNSVNVSQDAMLLYEGGSAHDHLYPKKKPKLAN